MQIKWEMDIQLSVTTELGVSLPQAELYLITKLSNPNINPNSHPYFHHLGIWIDFEKDIYEPGNIRLLTLTGVWEVPARNYADENKTVTLFQQTNSDSISWQMSSELSLV